MRWLIPLTFCLALGCSKGGVIEIDNEDRLMDTNDLDDGTDDTNGTDDTDDTGDIGGTDGTGDTGGTDGTDTDDTGDTGDTGDTTTKPDGSAYVGGYAGVVELEALTDFGNFPLAACDVTMDVDEEGLASGLTLCELDFGGGGYTLESEVGGDVDKDGNVLADMIIAVDLGGGSTYDLPVVVEGYIDDDLMVLEFVGEVDLGWASADLYGFAELEREASR